MSNSNKCAVFIDFDNTITSRDVLDDMIERFSINDRWIDLERKWKRGDIGSRECLQGQVKGIRITKRNLDKYLAGVKLDPYFKRLIKFLNAEKIKTIVLSDNFDYILKRILSLNAIKGLKLYSNKLRFRQDRLIPGFPFTDKKCRKCAHCKLKNLLANSDTGSIIVYIGDGHSDVCPAKYADIVFAKEDLLSYYRGKKSGCLAFKSLKEVYDYFRRRALV